MSVSNMSSRTPTQRDRAVCVPNICLCELRKNKRPEDGCMCDCMCARAHTHACVSVSLGQVFPSMCLFLSVLDTMGGNLPKPSLFLLHHKLKIQGHLV